MRFDRKKSLQELEGLDFDIVSPESALVAKVQELYTKPLNDLTVDNLRFMIGQNVGLNFLMSMALELLEDNPLIRGDYYEGDLLKSVLTVQSHFWQEQSELYWRVREIVDGLLHPLKELLAELERFHEQK